MEGKHIVLSIIVVLSCHCPAVADRALERSEILAVFQTLTSQQQKTWMPAGVIEATHEEYRAPEKTDANWVNSEISRSIEEYQSDPDKNELTEAFQKMTLDAIPFNVRYRLSNEYTMHSTTTVRFDGDRFYWEINVDSRTDSVKPGPDLKDNFMTEQFNLDWNTKRIFAWNGADYTTYFLPGNCAVVDAMGNTPHVVTGPLTAGFVPWGYGLYSYEDLCAAECSATEKYVAGQTQVHLLLNYPDGSEMFFVTDPAKEYALLSYSATRPGKPAISGQYSNYTSVSGNWVPTSILLEQHETGTARLLARDMWEFTIVDGNTPAPESFDVAFEAGATVQYSSDVSDEPLMYRCSQIVDTDLLLAERLSIAANEGLQPQNCATTALGYAARQLGHDIPDDQLAQLVSEPDQTTSLYAMKEFAQSRGLFCRAVKTDIDTLKNLGGCQVILHIPGTNHFVVLAHVDDEYVWCIDLANNKFFYRKDLNFFGLDWADGVALLVSDQQIADSFNEINEIELHTIIGAAGWSCTRLLQTYDVVYCSDALGVCSGMYQEYYTRYGCEPAGSGTCSSSIMVRYKESPCIEDPYDPLACTVTGEWTCYYMRACA